MPSLIIGIAGIDTQRLVGPVAEDALDGLLVILDGDVTRCKEGTLVAVGHHNDGNIIVFAALVEAVLVVADDVAVDTRPEARKAHITVA